MKSGKLPLRFTTIFLTAALVAINANAQEVSSQESTSTQPSAAVRYNLIFTIFTPISIVAIRRNIVKIDDNLNSDKMHSYQWLSLKHESKWRQGA